MNIRESRASRMLEACERFGDIDAPMDWVGGETPRDIAESDFPLDRYLMVESNNIGCEYAFGTYESRDDAATYNVEQEYAADWEIALIVDLDSGEQWELVSAESLGWKFHWRDA